MTWYLAARSVSRPVREQLATRSANDWRVLAAFEQACNLVGSSGQVIALVSSAVGDGPLNIVLAPTHSMLPFQLAEPNTPAEATPDCLRTGPMVVDLSGATAWEPRPGWERLRPLQARMWAHLGTDKRFIALAPAGSLLAVTGQAAIDDHVVSNRAQRLANAVVALRAGWAGDLTGLHWAAEQLAGWGPGLTPAGDDYLCGAMLAAWLAHPDPTAFCQPIAVAAAPRTTMLSAAWLQAAAAGECTPAWHRLLAELASGTARVKTAVQSVMRLGATSGADMLAGFMALAPASRP
jgi:hypothetical protein